MLRFINNIYFKFNNLTIEGISDAFLKSLFLEPFVSCSKPQQTLASRFQTYRKILAKIST